MAKKVKSKKKRRQQSGFRRVLAYWGIKFRRFPIWLHIFNFLCAMTLLLLALAALIFLPNWQGPSMVVHGNVQHDWVADCFAKGDHAEIFSQFEGLGRRSKELAFDELKMHFEGSAFVFQWSQRREHPDKRYFDQRQALLERPVPETRAEIESYWSGLSKDRKAWYRKGHICLVLLYGQPLEQQIVIKRLLDAKDKGRLEDWEYLLRAVLRHARWPRPLMKRLRRALGEKLNHEADADFWRGLRPALERPENIGSVLGARRRLLLAWPAEAGYKPSHGAGWRLRLGFCQDFEEQVKDLLKRGPRVGLKEVLAVSEDFGRPLGALKAEVEVALAKR